MTKIFVAGHKGMVGSAICEKLSEKRNIEIIKSARKKLDLKNQDSVFKFLEKEQPDQIILAAAKVGGIFANNTYPAEFIYENLQIQCNIIHGAHLNNINKLLFLGSSCIYPKVANQPLIENCLLTGKLEPTNEPYAISKIAGVKMCESYNRQYGRDYRSVMPTNLYGPGDNYDLNNSHVVPALIRKFHDAKISKKDTVTVWGTGKPMREFLFVEDMAEASLYVHNLEKDFYKKNTSIMDSHINIGTGKDISIKELAETIKQIVGFNGTLVFDHSKPDGTSRKLLNVNLLTKLGWTAKTSLNDGLKKSYKAFLEKK